MGVTLKITDLRTGQRIYNGWNIGERECWICALPDIAEHFAVSQDEIGIEDAEDGDFVTVDGKRVAELRPTWNGQG